MSEWQTVAIGEICDLVTSGGTPLTSQKEYYHNGSIPWVKTKEVNQCRLYGTENHITQLGLDNSSAKLIPENSIIIAMYGDGKTAGRVALNKVPVTTNQACCNLILNKQKANYDFVFYNLMGRYDELVSKKTGSGQQNLNGKIIKEIEIDLPSLPEQKAIASVLSSLDDKIDLLHRQNKTLEAMAETLFRQWFIEEAKEDWVNVQLKDIVKQIKPGTNYQPKRLDSGIPFLNVRNLQNGQINLQGISFISQEEYERVHKAWKPEEGDVLISRIGTLGIVAVLGKRDMPMAVHYNMLVLKPSLTNTAFLYFLLRSQYFQEAYSSKARQSVQEYVAVEDAESIELKLPLNDAAFANKQDEFYCLFDKIRANLYQIQTLENLRDTLLPKLMSGEVRVQYQTEEVA